MTGSLIDILRGAIGPDHVLAGGDLEAWELDRRGRARGRALAVVRPGSTAEVAAVVRACAATGTAIVPQGGNTGLVLGSIPDDSGTRVVLSLSRMRTVREIDPANLTMTVEAGCVLHDVREAAAAAGLLFPLSLASEGSCTIGGNLATNAGGTQVLRYGNARELCLGLEVVTAAGEVWEGLSGLRKDNTGYDLRDLFVGSEGTLGVITAATLKLFPRPAATHTAWLAVPSMEQAVALLALAQRRLAGELGGFEVMGRHALSVVARHLPQLRIPIPAGDGDACCVLLEAGMNTSGDHAEDRFQALLAAALEAGCATDAVMAANIAQARAFWQVRDSISPAQAAEGLNIKHDIALPVSRIPDFVAVCGAQLEQAIPGVRLVVFGHLGDGNLHYNVQAPAGSDAAAFLHGQEARVNAIVHDAVAARGGSIAAEHGIGSLKVDILPRYKPAVALGLMRAIKRALDPLDLMNPGRVLRP
jgi:FAD/FMN-containing dehydrogenase